MMKRTPNPLEAAAGIISEAINAQCGPEAAGTVLLRIPPESAAREITLSLYGEKGLLELVIVPVAAGIIPRRLVFHPDEITPRALAGIQTVAGNPGSTPREPWREYGTDFRHFTERAWELNR